MSTMTTEEFEAKMSEILKDIETALDPTRQELLIRSVVLHGDAVKVGSLLDTFRVHADNSPAAASYIRALCDMSVNDFVKLVAAEKAKQDAAQQPAKGKGKAKAPKATKAPKEAPAAKAPKEAPAAKAPKAPKASAVEVSEEEKAMRVEIVAALSTGGSMSKAALSEATAIEKDVLTPVLASMSEEGSILRTGKGPATKYGTAAS